MNSLRDVTVIPAQPGWTLVQLWEREDGTGYLLHEEPVIAWLCAKELNGEGDVMVDVSTVTVNGNSDSGVLRRPDGSCCEQYGDGEIPGEMLLEFLRNRREFRRKWNEQIALDKLNKG
jgi:hypothetical protein